MESLDYPSCGTQDSVCRRIGPLSSETVKKLGQNSELKGQKLHPYKKGSTGLKQNHNQDKAAALVTAAACSSCWVLASDERSMPHQPMGNTSHLSDKGAPNHGSYRTSANGILRKNSLLPRKVFQLSFETPSMRMQSCTQSYQRLTVVVT